MAHTNEYLIKKLAAVQLVNFNAPMVGDTGTMADFPTSAPHTFIAEGAVHVSCEHGDNAGDYYGEFTGGDSRINSEIEKVAAAAGFYAEWVNPGCFAFYAE